jgi:apolipoprotein N-acyltransferase
MRLPPARLWGAAALSGVLQILPFPIAGPIPVWRTVFAWISLAPLLWALTQEQRGKRPWWEMAAVGYVSGFVWYMGSCYWIYQTMHLYGGLDKPIAVGILILFSLYLGLYHALFGWIVGSMNAAFGRQIALLISPFAWVAVELARGRITGLPWDPLGNTQIDNSMLMKLAPVMGVYGISFVIAAVNALWLMRMEVRERRYTRLAITFAGVAVVVLYVVGLRRIQRPGRAPVTATATLVQENLEVGQAATGPEPSRDDLLAAFSALSRYPGERMYLGIPELRGTPAVRLVPRPGPRDSNLIVWPESPAPFEENDPVFRSAMSKLAKESGAAIIAGNIGIARTDTNKRGYFLYNSASYLTPAGDFAGRYDKIHLVPFGEYVPFKDLFFFAQNLLHEAGTFDAGTRRTVFELDGHKYGTFICYESIFGNEVRQFVQNGADVLVNVSNDGWYGDTSAPWQHLNMARMRAIENHRWVLRATNTGVTAAIDPNGRVMEAAPRHVRTSIRVGFGYERDLTLYTRYGDVFAWLCVMVTVAGVVFGLRRRDAVN